MHMWIPAHDGDAAVGRTGTAALASAIGERLT